MDPREMDIFSFIQAKLKINDVEPLYQAVVASGASRSTCMRYAFASNVFDHYGLGAAIAERKDFWGAMEEAVASQPLRGGARCYFRGTRAAEAVKVWRERYPRVEDLFKELRGPYKTSYKLITSLPQFGLGSGFKLADQAERTCGCKIDFAGVGMEVLTRLPIQGLEAAAEYLRKHEPIYCAGFPVPFSPERLYGELLKHRWVLKAPPLRDRPLNIQEIETVLCNYGHSKWRAPGHELVAVAKELDGWGKLATKFRNNLGGGK